MIMVKAKDELGGQITPRGGVKKALEKSDTLKFSKGYDHAKRILLNAGAKDVFSGVPLGSHPGGTVKINQFVDSNLKTEKDNLYVCDCSVIPEAWGRPPSLTLYALGRRLGKHLVEVLR